jgi:hypothetical protein
MRDDHLGYCVLSSLGEKTPTRPLPPTYKEMVERESGKNPAYRKYMGRINLAEPNGMSELYKGMKGR